MYKKRERTQNWTPEEKRYLLELCEKRLDVLENKKIDSASSSLKGLTWNYIHEKFGERFGLERDVQRLREQWRRMKGHAKNEMMVESAQIAIEKREAAGGSLSDAIRRSLGVPQGRLRGSQHLPLGTSITSSLGPCEPSTSGGTGNGRLNREQVLNGLLRNALQNGTTACKVDSVAGHGELRDTKNFLGLKGKSSESNTSLSDDDENDLVIDIDIKEEIIEPIIDIDEREFPFVPRIAQGERKPLVSILAVECDGESAGAAAESGPGTSVRQRPTAPKQTADEMFALEMFKMRVVEQKRRMEMMEKEHKLRMEALELKRDTKRIKREMLIAENIENADRANAGRNETCAASSVRFGSDQLGSMGSGAGKGGGGGGSIREAGGAFGKMEAAKEEEFFYKQQREQLLKLKTDLTDEISFHEEQVKRHQEAIKRHTQRVSDIENKTH